MFYAYSAYIFFSHYAITKTTSHTEIFCKNEKCLNNVEYVAQWYRDEERLITDELRALTIRNETEEYLPF